MSRANTRPKVYSDEELARYSAMLTEEFVERRSKEEESLAGFYHERFVSAKSEVERIFDETDGLMHLVESGQALLLDGLLPTMRGMTRPTVSEDDFKNLADTGTVAASKFADNTLAESALGYIARNLNHDLFPWVSRGEYPTREQLHAACVGVAALIAEQKTKTSMRGNASKLQERAVRDALRDACSLRVVDGADFDMIQRGPSAGEMYSRETKVGGTKADVVLGLFDGRIMCLECKSSNSAVNSFKRLNHEVLDKVAKWNDAFGKQCVSGGVLEGCYSTANLVSAQDGGAYLFWSRHLEDLIDFINSTK